MPNCIMLVGAPGVGKSTWCENLVLQWEKERKWENDADYNPCLLSTDYYIERLAVMFDLTYNEAFQDVIKFAEKIMWRDAANASNDKVDVYVDRTNMSVKARKKFIDFFKPHGYTFDAIVFELPEKAEWERRLSSRPGKIIPQNVLDSMIKNFEMPSHEEGFRNIVPVNVND